MAYTKELFMEERTKLSSQNQWKLEANFMSCNHLSQEDDEILPVWLDEMLEDEKFRQEIRKMKEEIDAEIVIYEKWKKIMEGGLNNKNLNTEFQHGSHISKII